MIPRIHVKDMQGDSETEMIKKYFLPKNLLYHKWSDCLHEMTNINNNLTSGLDIVRKYFANANLIWDEMKAGIDLIYFHLSHKNDDDKFSNLVSFVEYMACSQGSLLYREFPLHLRVLTEEFSIMNILLKKHETDKIQYCYWNLYHLVYNCLRYKRIQELCINNILQIATHGYDENSPEQLQEIKEWEAYLQQFPEQQYVNEIFSDPELFINTQILSREQLFNTKADYDLYHLDLHWYESRGVDLKNQDNTYEIQEMIKRVKKMPFAKESPQRQKDVFLTDFESLTEYEINLIFRQTCDSNMHQFNIPGKKATRYIAQLLCYTYLIETLLATNGLNRAIIITDKVDRPEIYLLNYFLREGRQEDWIHFIVKDFIEKYDLTDSQANDLAHWLDT